MQNHAYVERFVNLLDPAANTIFNMTVEDASARLGSGDAARVREIDGQFAIVHQNGHIIRMARSIGRPMRYFLAKQVAGPCLIVAERIDEIAAWLKKEGLAEQFHPSYTRMVPAHHILELALIGCPDPSPSCTRFFTPQRNRLSSNLDEIGRAYIGAMQQEVYRWLDQIPILEPIGVLFSGGIDSGAVFLAIYDALLKRGESPGRLKAFTLSLDKKGQDAAQAHEFLAALDLDSHARGVAHAVKRMCHPCRTSGWYPPGTFDEWPDFVLHRQPSLVTLLRGSGSIRTMTENPETRGLPDLK